MDISHITEKTEAELKCGYPKNNATWKPWYELHERFYLALTMSQFRKFQGYHKWLPYLTGAQVMEITKSKKLYKLFLKARELA